MHTLTVAHLVTHQLCYGTEVQKYTRWMSFTKHIISKSRVAILFYLYFYNWQVSIISISVSIYTSSTSYSSSFFFLFFLCLFSSFSPPFFCYLLYSSNQFPIVSSLNTELSCLHVMSRWSSRVPTISLPPAPIWSSKITREGIYAICVLKFGAFCQKCWPVWTSLIIWRGTCGLQCPVQSTNGAMLWSVQWKLLFKHVTRHRKLCI